MKSKLQQHGLLFAFPSEMSFDRKFGNKRSLHIFSIVDYLRKESEKRRRIFLTTNGEIECRVVFEVLT